MESLTTLLKAELYNKNPQIDLRGKREAIEKVTTFYVSKRVTSIKILEISQHHILFEVREKDSPVIWRPKFGYLLKKYYRMSRYCNVPKYPSQMFNWINPSGQIEKFVQVFDVIDEESDIIVPNDFSESQKCPHCGKELTPFSQSSERDIDDYESTIDALKNDCQFLVKKNTDLRGEIQKKDDQIKSLLNEFENINRNDDFEKDNKKINLLIELLRKEIDAFFENRNINLDPQSDLIKRNFNEFSNVSVNGHLLKRILYWISRYTDLQLYITNKSDALKIEVDKKEQIYILPKDNKQEIKIESISDIFSENTEINESPLQIIKMEETIEKTIIEEVVPNISESVTEDKHEVSDDIGSDEFIKQDGKNRYILEKENIIYKCITCNNFDYFNHINSHYQNEHIEGYHNNLSPSISPLKKRYDSLEFPINRLSGKYKCSRCPKTFNDPSYVDLQEHLRMHGN